MYNVTQKKNVLFDMVLNIAKTDTSRIEYESCNVIFIIS